MKTLSVATFFALATTAIAQDHIALDNYVTDDVVAVAYLDLSKIDTIGMLEWVETLGFGPSSENRGKAMQTMLTAQEQFDQFAEHGVRFIYVLFRASDITYGRPTWVVPISANGDPEAVAELINAGELAPRLVLQSASRLGLLPRRCEAHGGEVLGANTAEQMELLKSKRPTQPRDLADAWEVLGKGHLGLLVFGDSDSRRVVREMFPKLPEPFQAIDGKLIADQLKWGGVVADLPPKPRLRLLAQTDSEATAKTLEAALSKGLKLLKQVPQSPQFLSVDELEALTDLIKAKTTRGQFVVSFDELLGDADRIARLVAPPVRAAQLAAQRTQRMNQFKRIVLAMLNYESARGSYPPQATHTDDGKPLLSWRVHILPYMEEGELYKQFRLDEPWDSEHNRLLIPLMPEVYADPDRAFAHRNAAGRTTYHVPTGPGTLFAGMSGPLIKDVTDGLSNTVMLVEVPADSASAWTEPKDWLVDFDNPMQAIRRNDRDYIIAAFCDGSVRILSLSMDTEIFKSLFTIAGGEQVDLP